MDGRGSRGSEVRRGYRKLKDGRGSKGISKS